MLSAKFRFLALALALALLLAVFVMSSAHAGIVTLTAESAGFDSDLPPGYARLKV